GFGVVDTKDGAFLLEPLAKLDGGGEADIVGVLLEGQAEHADGFILQHPERVGDLLEETLHLSGVDALDFLQQIKTITELLGDLDERAEVFREATAAEPEAGVE